MMSNCKLKIAYAIPEYVTEPEYGGLARYFDNVARLLADDGHRIVVFVQSSKAGMIEDYYPGITVIRVFTDLSTVNPLIPGSYMRHWSQSIKLSIVDYMTHNGQFDLIQYSNFMAYGFDRLNLPTVVRLSSYRPLLRAADKNDFDINESFRSIKIPDYMEDLSVLYADSVYGPSCMIADLVEKETGRSVDIIESPFYPKTEYCDDGVKDIYGDYILTFGSLKILKGAKTIGDSIYKILDTCRDLKWVIIGEEYTWKDEFGSVISPKEYIISHAKEFKDRCIIIGKQEWEKLCPIIKGARFCVMPSRIDNLPNTCIEAMSLKKVVIGTIGASFDQLLNDGKSGFLIKRENPVELADCVISTWRMEDEKLEEIGEEAFLRTQKMCPHLIRKQLYEYYLKTIREFSDTEIKYNDRIEKTKQNYNNILANTVLENKEELSSYFL